MCGHPLVNLLPPLLPQQRWVDLPRGEMPPHRAILNDWPVLLVHHYCQSSRPPRQQLNAAELAGCEKTAKRLRYLLPSRHCPEPRILLWPRPEVVVFTTFSDPVLHSSLVEMLQQLETLSLRYADAAPYMIYRRC